MISIFETTCPVEFTKTHRLRHEHSRVCRQTRHHARAGRDRFRGQASDPPGVRPGSSHRHNTLRFLILPDLAYAGCRYIRTPGVRWPRQAQWQLIPDRCALFDYTADIIKRYWFLHMTVVKK